MSQYGDGDYCSVWEDRWIKSARKSHRCHACDETIDVCRRYHVTFSVFDGEPSTVKRCERCQLIYGHLHARIRSAGDPDEFCDQQLNCGHEYQERWGEAPPPELAALAFWLPGDPLPDMVGNKKCPRTPSTVPPETE